MAVKYDISVEGHPNIYNNYSPREMNIYFSVPDAGVNEDTGLLLLVAGFGGHANSNVYKKMRDVFADQYNLVVVQSNYFGWEYMQADLRDESIENFNDMGIMQALDNISSVCIVLEILKDNGHHINTKKIIAYGHSHGAYLCYLCNVFAPNLFSLIIDNSAWLLPQYLLYSRVLYMGNGTRLAFNYLAKNEVTDREILNLPHIYKRFKNQCIIYSYHGTEDTLISIEDKKKFCLPLRKCFFVEVGQAQIDGEMFKSAAHGLDADFLLMFDHVMQNNNLEFYRSTELKIPTHRIETKLNSYLFDYDHKVPHLMIEPKKASLKL